MAWDYTKKSNYHYLDVANLDENLLTGSLFPWRQENEKNKLLLCDVSFVLECLLSRYQIHRGITINGVTLNSSSTPPSISIAVKHCDFQGADYLLDFNIFPSSSYSFPTSSTAINAFIRYKNNQKTTPPIDYYFSFGKRDNPDLTGILSRQSILDYCRLASTLRNYYTALFYSTWQPLEGTTFDVNYISKEEHFTTDTDRICYKKISNFPLDNYDGEAWTIRTTPFYSLSLTNPAKSCVNIYVYLLAIFNDQINNYTKYQFIDITNKDAATISNQLINAGKSICPEKTASGTAQQYFYISYYPYLFVYAQSKITDTNPYTAVS